MKVELKMNTDRERCRTQGELPSSRPRELESEGEPLLYTGSGFSDLPTRISQLRSCDFAIDNPVHGVFDIALGSTVEMVGIQAPCSALNFHIAYLTMV